MNVVTSPKLPGQTAIASPDAKPEPFTVSVTLALPAGTFAGEMLVRVRSGGIVKVRGDDGAPPGFLAVITTVPGARSRLEGTSRQSMPNSHPIGPRSILGPMPVPFQESVAPC